MRWILERFEPHHASLVSAIKVGLGAAVAIGVLELLSLAADMQLLIAPLGATAVLVFGVPASPLAQPINVIGGYALALVATTALLAIGFPPIAVAAIGLGITLTAMLMLRVTHPPAGAIPLLAAVAPMNVPHVVLCVAVGALILVVVAAIFHRIPPRQIYPRRGTPA
ncbi:MAG: HPP family protein [Labrys sp. (in: a-proteobacteria)]